MYSDTKLKLKNQKAYRLEFKKYLFLDNVSEKIDVTIEKLKS